MTAVLGPTIGAELLTQLGFLHVPGLPAAGGSAYLFVGLRRRPTLRHFDPERVDYWVSEDGRGVRASIDWGCAAAPLSGYAWGLIRVVDRLGVSNEYLSFGGELSVERLDGVRVLVFSSEAPILARGGHSQGWDAGAVQLGAFFARLRAAVGSRLEAEHQIAGLPPLALYAAYLAYSLERYGANEQLPAWRPRSLALLRSEERRLRNRQPAAWAAGAEAARLLLVNPPRDLADVGRAQGSRPASR